MFLCFNPFWVTPWFRYITYYSPVQYRDITLDALVRYWCDLFLLLHVRNYKGSTKARILRNWNYMRETIFKIHSPISPVSWAQGPIVKQEFRNLLQKTGNYKLRADNVFRTFWGVGGGCCKPVDVIISISVPIIELSYFKFWNSELCKIALFPVNFTWSFFPRFSYHTNISPQPSNLSNS